MTSSKGPSLPPSIAKIVLPFLVGIALAILAFIWWTRLDPVQGTGALEEERFTEVVLSGLPKLVERWQEGDAEESFGTEKWACDELPASPHVGPEYLRCNHHYLECWARGNAGSRPSIPVTLDQTTYQLRLRAIFPEIPEFTGGKRHTRWVTRSELENPIVPTSGVMVELSVENMKGTWRMILEDTCRGAELPERRYSYGARPERHERVREMDWDNDGRKILLDKYLVSQGEVNDWILATRPAHLKLSTDKKTLALPSTDLNNEQQTQYCAWLGKRRMEAHLWDAATMLPSNVKRPFPDFVVKSWLPWSRDKKDSFFEKAELNRDWQPTVHECMQAYVKECVGRFPYIPHNSDNVSWMGIYHVLGGTPEEMRNPIEGKLSLKASSFLLPGFDEGHQLGRRLEGTGHGTGFRCYREDFP